MKMIRSKQAGFTLIEMMVAMAVMLIVAGVTLGAMMQMINVQASLTNRSEMHGSLRGATELMQQEIGQAGKITLGEYPNWWKILNPTSTPPGLTMGTAVVGATLDTPVTNAVITVNGWPYANNMYVGEYLTIDTGNSTTAPYGDNQETVQITAVTSNTFTATFTKPHLIGAPIQIRGGFATGIVPPDQATLTNQGIVLPAGYLPQQNGSTGYVLKLYGDLNNEWQWGLWAGAMQYVEFTCDVPAAKIGNPATVGNLYRNTVFFAQSGTSGKQARTPSMILLNNLEDNATNAAGVTTPCFTYNIKTVNNHIYVVNVQITLTSHTQYPDPQTHRLQKEQKALLNVSPRNIFQTWMLDDLGAADHVQPMPQVIFDPATTTGLITIAP